jgi:hypothetical protein
MATASPSGGGSVGMASMWMLGLGILLFWIPPFGPFIAGFVGGRKAGSVGGALMAAFLPALVVAGIVLVIGTLGGLPFVGAAIGAVLFVAFIIEFTPLLLGALIGGALAR